MDTSKSWIIDSLVPKIVQKNWPSDTFVNAEIDDRLGGNATDGGFASYAYRLRVYMNPSEDAGREKTTVAHHLFVKKALDNELLRAMHNSAVQFKNEIWLYEYAAVALDPTNDANLWPRCLLSVKESDELEAIVMQDMQNEGGFRLTQSTTALDETHARLALERLAKFHALGYTLRHRDPTKYKHIINGFQEGRFSGFRDEDFVALMKVSIERGLKPLREVSDCKEFLSIIDRLMVDPFEYQMSIVRRRNPKIDVLCHGDFLRNNMLFQYDTNGRPRDIRFIDFGTCFERNPAMDFTTFLYMSVCEEARTKGGLENLMNCYHHTLITTLSTMSVPDPWLGDTAAIIREIGRYSLFVYTLCSFFLPVMMADRGEFSMEEMIAQTLEERKQNCLALGGIEATEKLTHILIDLKDRCFQQLW